MTIFEQLERDEGLVRRPYTDSLGFLTFGIGHKATTPLTEAACRLILHDDVAATVIQLEIALPWVIQLSQPRYGAMVNLAYNLGIGGLLGFVKMLAAMRAGDWSKASRELLDSKYSRQVGARAERVAKQIRENHWV